MPSATNLLVSLPLLGVPHTAMQAKAPIVEVLEERLLKAAEDRAEAASAAAGDDDREELEAAQVRLFCA